MFHHFLYFNIYRTQYGYDIYNIHLNILKFMCVDHKLIYTMGLYHNNYIIL